MLSSMKQSLTPTGVQTPKAFSGKVAPIMVYDPEIKLHPNAKRAKMELAQIKWRLDALKIHAKLLPHEADPDSNLFEELEKDFGLFRDNQSMHMKNLNEKLKLRDVVSFHENIAEDLARKESAGVGMGR